jgi:hypothetical protein
MLVATRSVRMLRTIVTLLLVAGCAIKPAPAQPREPETRASVQRDCEHECSVTAENRVSCMERCELRRMPLRCGRYIVPHRAEFWPSALAITVVVGWLVASTVAIRTTY